MTFVLTDARYYNSDAILKSYACLYKYHIWQEKQRLFIQIMTLNDLMNLQKEIKQSLIIEKDYDDTPMIMIYNDYIE